MRVIETTLFKYSELSDTAKEKAREWYARASEGDNFFAECVIEDAATIADLMGIDLNLTRTNNGNYKPSIFYSGFWSQGDGASFNCNYQYKKGSVADVMNWAPNDKELHRIARALQTIQKRHFYKLRAKSRVSGHYVHARCMSVDAWHTDDEYRDIGEAENDIQECLRDFANWIYKRLETEWEYQNSESVIAENIECNEYEFTEDGEIL